MEEGGNRGGEEEGAREGEGEREREPADGRNTEVRSNLGCAIN